MTVNSYNTWPSDPVQAEREAIQQAEREKARVFSLIAKETLPNGFSVYRGKLFAFFDNPQGVTLHRKPLESLNGWLDWYDLCKTIASNHINQ